MYKNKQEEETKQRKPKKKTKKKEKNSSHFCCFFSSFSPRFLKMSPPIEVIPELGIEKMKIIQPEVFVYNPTYSIFVEKSLEYFQKRLNLLSSRSTLTLSWVKNDLDTLAQHVQFIDLFILISATIFIALARKFLTTHFFQVFL